MEQNRPNYKIGVDIGGTKVNLLFFSEAGRPLHQQTIATDRDVTRIAAFVHRAAADFSGTPVSIGVGVPGTVDRQQGSVIYAPNLGWRDVPLKKAFAAYFDLPFAIGQDTEAAAVGEFLFGAGRGMREDVYKRQSAFFLGIEIAAGGDLIRAERAVGVIDRVYIGEDVKGVAIGCLLYTSRCV